MNAVADTKQNHQGHKTPESVRACLLAFLDQLLQDFSLPSASLLMFTHEFQLAAAVTVYVWL
ncbi:unnamed protein product [Ectocarpus sp. 4 AP-2014]